MSRTVLHNAKAGVWCALHARNITGSLFYVKTILENMLGRSCSHFFRKLTNEKKLCGHFEQDSAAVKTKENFMKTLSRVPG
jgi:hypothetical protein